jgi:hypothetical protein
VNGDTFSVTFKTSAVWDTGNGVYPIAGSYPISQDQLTDPGQKLSNYSVNALQGVLTIAKLPLTILCQNISIGVNEALPNLNDKLVYTGFVGGELNSDGHVANPGAVWTSAPAFDTGGFNAANKGNYTWKVTSATAVNYTVTTITPGTITVGKIVPTVTWADHTALYGDLITDNAASDVGGSQSGVSKVNVYDASASVAGTFSYSGFTKDATMPAGTYTLSVHFKPDDAHIGNYAEVDKTSKLTVNKRSIRVILQNASRTYGTNNPAFSWVVPDNVNPDDSYANGHGFVNGDTKSSVTFNPPLVLATTAVMASPVQHSYTNLLADGTVQMSGGNPVVKDGYKIFVGQNAAASNYTIKYTTQSAPDDETQTNATLTINKALLKISAQDQTVAFNNPIPTPVPLYDGFRAGDDASVLQGTLSVTPTAQQGNAIADYPIVVSGVFAANYTVNFINGTTHIVASSVPVTWGSLAAVTYGTPLSATQLSATSTVGSTVVFNPPLGSILHAGTQPLTATFTPTVANYAVTTVTNPLVVNKASLAVKADDKARVYSDDNPPLTISYSGFVGADTVTNIDVAPVAATSATKTSNAGTYEIALSGGSDNDYALVLTPGTLTVSKATANIVWSAPAAITYGTALGIGTQLNASVTGVDGTLVYNPTAGTKLNAGAGQPLTVVFTPSDANAQNYNTVTKTVNIDVNPATPTITWPNPVAISYPAALGAGQLNASADVGGTFTYSPAAGTVLMAGPQTLSATFTPSSQNYTTATATVGLTVNKGTPTITWPTPANISTGTPLSSTQLNATVAGNVAGDLAYSPPAGTVLPTGAGQTLSVFFLPTDTANYKFVQASVYINVGTTGTKPTITGQPQNVSVAAGGSATFSVIASGTGLTYQWQFNGTAISGATSASYTVASAANSNAGSYSVVVSNSSGSVTSQQAVLTITAAAPGQYTDLNGDGSSDLLFESDQGFLADWSVDKTGKLKTAGFLTPNNVGDVKWRIVGEGDFNGDTKTDILFQHTDGTLAVWYMNGTSLSSASLLSPSNPGDKNWRVVGTGDFNGDKKTDIVFQHTDGTLAVWYMNGSTLSAPALLSPSNPGDAKWRVAGVGDVNKDGKPDLVFQHTDGTLAAWMMNGTSLSSAALLTPNNPGSPAFRVVAVTDINQDGNVDLVFQNTGTRRLAVWMMNGTTLTTSTATNPEDPGAGWQVVGPK